MQLVNTVHSSSSGKCGQDHCGPANNNARWNGSTRRRATASSRPSACWPPAGVAPLTRPPRRSTTATVTTTTSTGRSCTSRRPLAIPRRTPPCPRTGCCSAYRAPHLLVRDTLKRRCSRAVGNRSRSSSSTTLTTIRMLTTSRGRRPSTLTFLGVERRTRRAPTTRGTRI